jgi:simple sugar transport system substrate-binding protein
MKRVIPIIVVLALAIAVFAVGAEKAKQPGKKYEIVMVVKLEGIAWFDNMRLGIEQFAKDSGMNAYQIGADTADPAAQVALIEDLIAKGVDAILAVPNSPESLVPVFKKANDSGILTFTHEASNQKQVSYDIEAFDNAALGQHIMDIMAGWMGGQGEWVRFVGHLTSPTHNEWADAEEKYAKEKFPKLKMVAPRIEEQENQRIAYEKTLELMKTYPKLKGIIGIASSMAGGAQAITEKGVIGQVAMFGTSLPSMIGEYIEAGAAFNASFWVPADAGYVTANVAYHMLQGKKITEGMNLGKPGYEKITIKKNKFGVPVIYGQAWRDVNKANLKDWKNPDGSYKL